VIQIRTSPIRRAAVTAVVLAVAGGLLASSTEASDRAHERSRADDALIKTNRAGGSFWVAENRAGSESFSFAVKRHGSRIRSFDGGLSSAVRNCAGTVSFARIPVSRSGRFQASRTIAGGALTLQIRGRFTSSRRATVFVRRIEAGSAGSCDTGFVRFRARPIA